MALLFSCVSVVASAQMVDTTSEKEAHEIGVDAHIYLFPLVRMDLTRKQFTNVESGKGFGKGPMNMFVA